MTEHPFTRVQITEKGLDRLMEFLDVMRAKSVTKSRWAPTTGGTLG